MKLNAICMVKNEVDIVGETLINACRFCHRIYVFDNGSTDGTYELLQKLSATHEQIVIAAHSDEMFKNQLRNRVYNMYHNLYEDTDWWYILDADELLVDDPRPMLEKAAAQNKNAMRAWMAQFYFTDADMAQYDSENHAQPITQRRRYYRINWREPRFFLNAKDTSWPETISGRFPPFCNRLYAHSPVLRHYAQRTPEQITARVKIREHNPYSFFHVKNKSQSHWIKPANTLFYYNEGEALKFPLGDKLGYYFKECKCWLTWRWKNIISLPHKIFAKLSTN